jgi:hypothetical protein
MTPTSILLALVGFVALGIGVIITVRSKELSLRIAASRDRRAIVPISDRAGIAIVVVCGILLTVAGIILVIGQFT